jgi:hypothetical protein
LPGDYLVTMSDSGELYQDGISVRLCSAFKRISLVTGLDI